MKKQNKIIFICLALFMVVLATALYLNRDRIQELSEFQKNALVRIVVSENEKIISERVLSMEEIMTLSEQNISVIQRSSTFGSGKYLYTGVLLKDLLLYCGADIEEKLDIVIITGADGYTTALSAKEIKEDSQAYLCYYKDGDILGTKAEGGSGPFQLVIADDVFAQRWVRFVSEIKVIYK